MQIFNPTADKTGKNEQFKFSLGQIISLEENRDMPSRSTLNEKMSDFIGEASINFNENLKLTNSFLVAGNTIIILMIIKR